MFKERKKRQPGKSIALLQKFMPYFRPYWRIMCLDLFCASMTTICDLVLPMIIRYFTNMATMDLAALTVRRVLLLGGAYVLLRMVDAAANYYMQSIGHIMGTHIETDMRRDMFAHLQRLPHSYYDNTKIGQIMSRITTDLFDIAEFAHHFPEEMFITIIKIVVAFIILSTMNLSLTVIIFIFLPFMVFFSNKFSVRLRKSFMESRKSLGELNARVEDSLSGIRVVKSFANEELEKEKFADGNHTFFATKKAMYFNMAGFQTVTRLFDGVMYIAVVIIGAIYMIHNAITVPDFVAYILYVQTLLTSIRRIVEYAEQFQRGITGIERFTEVLEEPPRIENLPGARELKDVRGDIDFEHVTFAYNNDLGNVLTDINIHVPAGESVALVGPSGGGKTTLCNLIPRFYEIDSGRILIDGQDIRDFTLESLRGSIGMVQQDVYLFSGSVRENIAYGKPGASHEEIVQAAKLAGAHEFIMDLENGYDTYVGEHGVKLSGGQKQRISIARVFLKNPPILILDEATSALDNESEHLVQQSLERLMKGRTTFTIAHRLTTIKNASTILVLTDEGIVERGNHRELMEKQGLYYSLYSMYVTSQES